MTQVWRVVKRKYAQSAYSGIGSVDRGARWHPAGQLVCYASENAALATLEVLVRLSSRADLRGQVLVPAEIPDALLQDAKHLPDMWDHHPYVDASQMYGAAWLESRSSLGLRVPSAIVPGNNVLINPRHEGYERVVVGTAVEFRDRVASHTPS